jgi:type I restriction-modification system DNA methylase subunit
MDISELVEHYRRNRETYTSGQYNETQLRREFLDPFFALLGWDIDNKHGYAEAYKDVVHEDVIKIGVSTKAPDYSFRIGGTRKFFVEAKKPSIHIKDDIDPAFQLRRYAWSAKLPLSILTNFEGFSVYDCRLKPDKTDKASTGRILYITCDEYEEKWDYLSSIFSREALLQGSFDKYAESTKTKKGTAEVDTAFLKEIELWRELLARNLALRNPELTRRELNFVVQATIDRIVFLRICEDRGIEDYGRLMSLLNGIDAYKRLCQFFRLADDKYNSGLFHFRGEKDRPEPPDDLSLNVLLDDKTLKEIVKNLYYPDSPYEFSVLPADILGQVYEQFLGKVIHLSAGHRATIEDKPEVKKVGGVFYTPRYIVDYIVKNTVGELLEGKTPKQAASLKILDPACGSGSFLIGAYQCLLDWHRDWYAEHTPQKWATGKKPALYQAQGGEWRLTTIERKRILLNNIFGVDIDPQAVEVTKLSLLLKVLEGATDQLVSRQGILLHERVLPDLGGNIKCGNSLIGPDFYEGRLTGIIDEEERLRVNVFDWKKEFAEIMPNGGFDAVIGNPPYVRQEMLGDFKGYFQQHYKTYDGAADLYVYFIERGMTFLKNRGLFSYIVANKWMRANYGMTLRKWLKAQNIEEIIDFGDLPVFQKATTYPCIIRVSKNKPNNECNVVAVKTLEFSSLDDYAKTASYIIDRTKLIDSGWSLSDDRTEELLAKIKKQGMPLGEYVKGKIFRGVLTGLNEAFVIDTETRSRLIAEDQKSAELIKPFLMGRDIKRFQPPQSNRFLIFTRRGINIKEYPAIYRYLLQFKDRLMPKPKGWEGGE